MTGPPVVTCVTCAGLTFNLVPCLCRSGGNRLLVDWDDDVGETYRDCRTCGGAGTIAHGCVDCRQRGVRRAQFVLTVVNLDTGAVASRNVVPGSMEPTPGPEGGWCLALAPLLDELTSAVGAGGLVDRRRPWEAGELNLPLDRSWRPDLPAERRDVLVAEAITRRGHQPWRVHLGRTQAPPVERPEQVLRRFCALADLLCLDLVVEARRQPRAEVTWHLRFEVPGGDVPPEGGGWATDLPAALALTTVADALAGLGDRGLTAPAYTVGRRPAARPAPPVVDLDRFARRVRADLGRAPAAQAIWRDGRWWHTRLLPGGTTEVLLERDTGQVSRRRTTVLRREGEPPVPSWQGVPIRSVPCPDCAPGSRLHRCDCTPGGQPADPGCARCSGAGFAPSVFSCPTCRGGRRQHQGLTVTVTDLRTRARHELWQPRGEAASGLPRPAPHRLAGRYRLADRAATFGVRPGDLTEADGGQPVSGTLLQGLSAALPYADPVRHFVTSAAAGRPGARLIVVAVAPDVPPLAEVFRLAAGLCLTLAVTARDRHDGDDLPDWRGLSWNVELVPPGTPVDRLAPPVRPTVEAAIAFCLRYLDNAVTAAVPVDAEQPITVPQAPAPPTLADPVPLIARLAGHLPGDEVTLQLDRGGCRVHLRDRDGIRLLAHAATLADAVRALGLPPN